MELKAFNRDRVACEKRGIWHTNCTNDFRDSHWSYNRVRWIMREGVEVSLVAIARFDRMARRKALGSKGFAHEPRVRERIVRDFSGSGLQSIYLPQTAEITQESSFRLIGTFSVLGSYCLARTSRFIMELLFHGIAVSHVHRITSV